MKPSIQSSLRRQLLLASVAISFLMIMFAVGSTVAMVFLVVLLDEYDLARTAILPALICLGIVAATWVFVDRIMVLHWESVRHHSRGWVAWTRGAATKGPLGALGLELKALLEEIAVDSPRFSVIRVTKSMDFSAHALGDDKILEVGAFALATMDIEEVKAVIAHELGHLAEGKDALAVHEDYLQTYSLLQFLRSRYEALWMARETPDNIDDSSWFEKFLLSRIGRSTWRAVRDSALALSEWMFFGYSIHLAQQRVDSFDARERRSCEFRCDRFAASHVSPEMLARALARSGAVWMSYKAHAVELSDYRNHKRFDRVLRGGTHMATVYASHDLPWVRVARTDFLALEPNSHPSSSDRIRAVCPDSPLLGPAWDLPEPRVLLPLDKCVEMWTRLARLENLASETERIAQSCAREAALSFQDNTNSKFLQSLSKFEREMGKRDEVLAQSLDVMKFDRRRRVRQASVSEQPPAARAPRARKRGALRGPGRRPSGAQKGGL